MFLSKIDKREIFVLLNIFLLILHINTDTIYTTSYYLFNSDFLNTSKFLRSITPYIIFINFIFYFSLNFNKKIQKIVPIYWLFFSYCLFQSLGLLFSENNNLNLVWIFSFFFTIILFGNDNQNFVERKFYLIILIFSIIFVIFFTPSLYKYLTTPYNFHNYYPDSFSPYPDEIININDRFSIHTMVVGESPPRSTGMARISLILIIFFIFYDIKKENFLKKIIIVFFSVVLFLYQSRIVIGSYFLIIFLISLYEFKIKQFLKKIIIYLLVPILVSFFILHLKSFINSKNFYEPNIKFLNPDIGTNKIIRPFNFDTSFDSGRINIWKKIIYNKDLNIMIGSGPQADRLLINQSASNAMVYSIAASGFFGIIFVLGLYFYFIKKFFFYYFFKKKNMKENWLIYCSIFIIFFLMIRSLVETTFSVFSLDLIILLACISILENDKNSYN